MRRLLMALSLLAFAPSLAAADRIAELTVRGNKKVEADAILTSIKSSKGEELDPKTIREDIKKLHDLGYFSDIKVYRENIGGGVRVIIDVKEKPAIVAIKFNGVSELKEDDFKDKLETKVYTIVNESTINNDLRMIEKQYLEKGYYLAKASYKIEPNPSNENEVTLLYNIEEGGKVLVGDVHIMGNVFFSDADLIDKFFSRPYTRMSNLSAPGSVYNDEFIKRDTEVISYLYKDMGFAEVNVGAPVKIIEEDRRYVRLTFELEEGIQYNVGGIEVTGDVLYTAEELKFGIHGGDMETSLMLAFRPETVDRTAAADFRSTAEGAAISPVGPLSYGWIARDLNPAGTVGNASLGTAEKGRATAAHQVTGFVALLQTVAAMSLEGFDPVVPAF